MSPFVNTNYKKIPSRRFSEGKKKGGWGGGLFNVPVGMDFWTLFPASNATEHQLQPVISEGREVCVQGHAEPQHVPSGSLLRAAGASWLCGNLAMFLQRIMCSSVFEEFGRTSEEQMEIHANFTYCTDTSQGGLFLFFHFFRSFAVFFQRSWKFKGSAFLCDFAW